MAHNTMRLDSINDRYVTETMIDLNLDLNEEIDFDFFDNPETPSKEPLTEEHETANVVLSRPCSPLVEEDDDDVQINPHLLGHDLRLKQVLQAGAVVKDTNSSFDSIEDPLSTGTENEEHYIGNFDEYEPNTIENTKTANCNDTRIDHVSLPQGSVTKDSIEASFSQKEMISGEESSRQTDYLNNEELLKSSINIALPSRAVHDEKAKALPQNSSLSQTPVISRENSEDNACKKNPKEDALRLIQDKKVSSKSSESHDENASSQSSKSHKSEGSGSGYDSDEGCPFEGSDSDELLLGVHTLTIIPRESEETITQREMICGAAGNGNESQMIHSTACEKALMTARSSSGYSSASCKAHGCIVSRGNISKADSRLSEMKVNTPDMDEFIKSFHKVQPNTPASFTSTEKYSASKKRKRRNMSFSNAELQRIERENAILLNKIVLQQRARPSILHKYERRVTSNAINRARQLKKIESENEILLRKIQDVKRKSGSSTQSSRCISQASAPQS